MTKNNKNIVIVGSGITGMIASILMREKNPNCAIYLIEKEKQIGGLLKSYKYNNGLIFDHGMHNFNETGIVELDNILWDILGNDWIVLENTKRDLAGLYFNKKLQENSIYPDIRNFEESFRIKAIGEVLELKKNKKVDFSNVYNFASTVLGKTLRENVVRPSLEKIFGKKIEELHHTAALMVPLERVVAFDLHIMKDLQKSKIIRESFAFTEQEHLPLKYSSGKKSFYPKKFGTWRIVDALKEILKKNRIKILCNQSIENIGYDSNSITGLKIKSNIDSSYVEINDIINLIWTINVPSLYGLLFHKLPNSKPDPLKKTVLFNLIMEKKLNCGSLHYFHCYDPDFKTFRVNNYVNYCPDAINSIGYPVCVEMLVDEKELSSIKETDAIEEIRRMGLLENNKVIFSKKEILTSGFPMPTLKNISLIDLMRDEILNLSLDNLIIAGILSENNLFFQRHVLPDLYNKIVKFS